VSDIRRGQMEPAITGRWWPSAPIDRATERTVKAFAGERDKADAAVRGAVEDPTELLRWATTALNDGTFQGATFDLDDYPTEARDDILGFLANVYAERQGRRERGGYVERPGSIGQVTAPNVVPIDRARLAEIEANDGDEGVDFE
jgi:hypothetical protein